MILRRFVLALIAFSLMASVCAGAPSVKYQVDKNYPPYTFQNKEYLYGFDFSLITLVLDSTDYDVDYSSDSWDRVYKRLVKGDIDIGGIIAVTEERKKEVLFTKPLFNSYVSIYTLAHFRKIALEDLADLRVGVGKSYYTESLLRNTLHISPYQTYDDIDDALPDLLDGKIDVIFENQQLMDYTIISKNLKGIVVPQVTNLFPREHAYAVSKSRPELVEYMNHKLDQLKDNGVFEELYLKFFYTHSDGYIKARQEKVLFFLLIVAASLIVLGIAIKLYIDRLKKKLRVNYDQLLIAHENLQAQEEELAAQNEELLAKEEELLCNYNKLHYASLHDSLTGLPNREHLNEQLKEELEKAQKEGNTGAVLFIDLDDLKTINDTLGHQYGDDLIINSGSILVTQIKAPGFVARIGGDEFVVILPGQKARQELEKTASKLLHALAYEYDTDTIRLQTSASIGIALYPENGDTREEILKNADNAMYAAKKTGKNCWRFYEPSMQTEAYEQMVLKVALRSALNQGELTVVYQPQVRVRDHTVIGFEALLRWNSEQYGKISPDVFIPLAEQTGLIHSIGEWVLKESCFFAKHLSEQGQGHIRIGVNTSPIQLSDEYFVTMVQRVITNIGLRPEQLELEITETALMSSLDNVVRNLAKLSEMGVRLALDDFGTGYSSLTYLHRLPVNTLKIDKSFIDRMFNDTTQNSIIKNIIDMAHTMKMVVVAEGVEKSDQVSFLAQTHCDYIQGYYFGRPEPPATAIQLLKM
ncbi:EAL domain-containing protein [Anaeroarcus burkinensis]|uniref:EAL domain-containing protein n=1 Tax=Anaeroarcus burkinensis TaxID=82376 RepID=UPI00041153B1|nr:EAL domain-containing protein [Anaeroarcus burkinensis]